MSTSELEVSLDGVHFFPIKTLRVKVIDQDQGTEVRFSVNKRGVETDVIARGRLVGSNGASFDAIIKGLQ